MKPRTRGFLGVPVWLLLPVALLAVGWLGACGDDDDDDDATSVESTEEAEAEATTEPTGEETEAVAEGTVESTSPEAEGTFVAEERIDLVAVHGSSPDFIALPTLAAWDILEERNIHVEQQYVEDGATAIQAIAQGQAQIATNIAANTGVAAAEQGVNVKEVVGAQRMSWALAARPEFATLEDLQGRSIAVHSDVSFTKTVADWFAEEYGIEMDQLIIPGSEVRAQALANGEIDSTIIDIADVVRISQVSPDSFTVVTTLGESLGDLISGGTFIDADWADENPEIALEVTKAMVEGLRRLSSDRDYAVSLAQEALPEEDPQVVEDVVDQYLERELWDPNGFVTEATAQATLDFYAQFGQVDVDPATADLNKYFAIDLLNQALDALGRE
ncbi:MAG: PhnD/SsuA/transferrin family substrate-binding protein [Dehalococcoidia bacterium]|nr:PhnD/SsuA/transferrin family substrate-binding protein [Dehalococcoidia bacterium]